MEGPPARAALLVCRFVIPGRGVSREPESIFQNRDSGPGASRRSGMTVREIRFQISQLVMAGLDPAIHLFLRFNSLAEE
jgi:hypothetical protein